MNARLERLLSTLLALSIFAMAIVLVHREWGVRYPPSVVTPEDLVVPPEYLEDWQELLTIGVPIGDTSATIKLITFADLQCPACRRFHRVYRRVEDSYGGGLSLTLVHFPLPYHPSARAAARALECAAKTRHEGRFLDVAYEKQDSLGAKSWDSYAAESGVTDVNGFADCMRDTMPVTRIQEGIKAGARIGIRGTPTVVVNGWRFAFAPRDSVLREAIEDVRYGRRPLGAVGTP